MILRQTVAMFVDAYRELNYKKLFWIVLALSAVFVAAFACLGINEKGLTVLWWDIGIDVVAEFYQQGFVTRSLFYKWLFLSIGFGIWLTWAATILALISTAGIVPDFVSSGSIELTLSKPISRLRLFLTKFATGLLFVALQVTVFTLMSFLAIGFRGGGWLTSLFWAVPICVLFYSYLFSVTTLVGVVTRSSVASLLVTLVIWVLVFLVHFGETNVVLPLKIRSEMIEALQQQKLVEAQADLKEILAKNEDPKTASGNAREDGPPGKFGKSTAGERASVERSVEIWTKRVGETGDSVRLFRRIHAIFFAVKSLLPKTSETMGLLERRVVTGKELDSWLNRPNKNEMNFSDADAGVKVSPRLFERELTKTMNERSVGWIIGTSLAFEFVILGAACWIFCRRDF